MKRERRKVNIPVASMSDIAFLLLVFLMVTSLASSQKTARITLPRIQNTCKEEIKKSINIGITERGKYFLDDKEIDPEQLLEKVEALSGLNRNITVFIFGDETTEYGYVDQVILILKEAGLRNVIFVTKKIKAQPDKMIK